MRERRSRTDHKVPKYLEYRSSVTAAYYHLPAAPAAAVPLATALASALLLPLNSLASGFSVCTCKCVQSVGLVLDHQRPQVGHKEGDCGRDAMLCMCHM